MSQSTFDYRVRESPRAKNIRLKVTPQQGLEVIVPTGYERKRIPALLERKKHWIHTALERAEALRPFFEPQPDWRLPRNIHLPAIGRAFHVEARQTSSQRVTVRGTDEGIIEIVGNIGDEAACRAALMRWLTRMTREYLVPRLHKLSTETGLAYRQVLVKRQKTRWASCSRRKTISLNLKLLFLPPIVVDYVLIHELCHLAEMNHSAKFWARVAEHCLNYKVLDAQLREMWKVVPRWLMDSHRASSLGGGHEDI